MVRKQSTGTLPDRKPRVRGHCSLEGKSKRHRRLLCGRAVLVRSRCDFYFFCCDPLSPFKEGSLTSGIFRSGIFTSGV